ncbi:MAG TPA: glycosyltransferase family 39 protein [Polyangia bacterium]
MTPTPGNAAAESEAPRGATVATAVANPPTRGFLGRLSETQTSLLVILIGLLLYIPLAGTYGLWDPWETHYSEVARQMTKRGDFISLWWPGSPRDQAEFWSKPVLTFWLMSIGMHVARVGLPGGPPEEMAVGNAVEWAVRIPFCLMGVLAMYALYLVTSRFVSRRAGILAAVVAATCPMFSLVARQAMTDMAFVGPMAMALALGTLALFDDEDKELPRKKLSWLPWFSWPHHSLYYITIGVFALLALPQLIIDSIQLKVSVPIGGRRVLMYGAVVMIPYYLGFLGFIILGGRFIRYKAPFYLSIAAMLCGLAVLAKGFAGLGLPVIVFVAYLAFTWNWRRLSRAQILPGLLLALVALLVVAVPWHHAMYIRHGNPWWNELFGDNHWRRMVLGRHGDRGSFEYFLRELGYALLPWLAVAPAALAVIAMQKVRDVRRQSIYWLGAIWFVAAYAVVSNSMTKFHHYILPAIPGLAIVIGCFLDELYENRDARRGRLVAIAGLPLLLVVVQDLLSEKSSAQLFLWLFSYDYVHSPKGRPWPDQLDFRGWLTGFAVLFAAGTLGLSFRRLVRPAILTLSAAAVFFTWFLLDVYMVKVAPYWSQKYAIGTYYQHRRSPEEKLVAYQMYWRGETFYTKNEIYEGPQEERTVFDMEAADEKLKEWISNHRARRVYFMFERGRQARLQSLLPPEARGSFTVIYDKNNKFSVAYAEL